MDRILADVTSPHSRGTEWRGSRSCSRSAPAHPAEPENRVRIGQSPPECEPARRPSVPESAPSARPHCQSSHHPPSCPACRSTRYGWTDGDACVCGGCGEPLELDGAPAWLAWPRTRLERRFAEFHAANPHVFAEFERRALQLARAGARRIGAKAIAERIRWDIHIRTLGDEYKLNNSFVALYARLLIHHHPQLADVIETRQRRGEAA